MTKRLKTPKKKRTGRDRAVPGCHIPPARLNRRLDSGAVRVSKSKTVKVARLISFVDFEKGVEWTPVKRPPKKIYRQYQSRKHAYEEQLYVPGPQHGSYA